MLFYSNCAEKNSPLFLGNSQYFYVRMYGLNEHMSAAAGRVVHLRVTAAK